MTIPEFQQYKKKGKKLTVVTAYDALFTRIVEQAGLDVILVGDSLGMVVQGKPNTLSVTMEDMLYHTRMVAQAAQRALVIGDMPFLSYQVSVEEAVRNAGRFLQAGAAAVKIEGGMAVIDRVEAMTRFGIPVMGHVGMTPQSVNQSGGYKVAGKSEREAEKILEEAKELEYAGVFALVLECMPVALASKITQALSIPTIGIGAGNACDGQVLVTHDLLGLFERFHPKFAKQYVNLGEAIKEGIMQFKTDVETGKFPDDAHSYSMKEDELKGLGLKDKK